MADSTLYQLSTAESTLPKQLSTADYTIVIGALYVSSDYL